MKWSLIECFAFFLITFRLLYFVTRSVPYTIESERILWQTNLDVKRKSCAKTEQIFASIGSVHKASQSDSDQGLLTSKALTEVEVEVRACQSEIRRLEGDLNLSLLDVLSNFIFQTNYFERSVHLISRASHPGRSVASFGSICIDWRSSLDISIFIEVLPFFGSAPIFIAAAAITALGAYIGLVCKRGNKGLLLKTCHGKWLFYPFVLNKILLSKTFRPFRIAFSFILYFSAFTRFSNDNNSLLLSAFVLSGTLCYWAVYAWLALQLVAVHATAVLKQYQVKRSELALRLINAQVAEAWVSEYLYMLDRLSDLSLLEVLRIAQLHELSAKGKEIVRAEISARPLLVSLAAMTPRKPKENTYCVVAQYTNALVTVQNKLGPRKARIWTGWIYFAGILTLSLIIHSILL